MLSGIFYLNPKTAWVVRTSKHIILEKHETTAIWREFYGQPGEQFHSLYTKLVNNKKYINCAFLHQSYFGWWYTAIHFAWEHVWTPLVIIVLWTLEAFIFHAVLSNYNLKSWKQVIIAKTYLYTLGEYCHITFVIKQEHCKVILREYTTPRQRGLGSATCLNGLITFLHLTLSRAKKVDNRSLSRLLLMLSNSLDCPEGSYHLLGNLRSFWAIFLHPCVGDDQINGDCCIW